MKLLTISTVIFLLCIPCSGNAGYWSTKFCFGYQTDFIDGSTGDYMGNNATPIAPGIEAKVVRNFGSYTVWSGHTDSQGCTPTWSLWDGFTYTISMSSYFQINNQGVDLTTNDDNPPVMYTYIAITDFRPSPDGGGTYLWPWDENNQFSNLLAATSWPIRQNYYLPSEDGVRLVPTPYPNETFSAPETYFAYINLDDRSYKFRTSEIFGQAWFNVFLNGSNNPTLNFSYSGLCPQRFSESKAWDFTGVKYTGITAYYGFGLYYAAAAYNQENEANCDYFMAWNADLDHNLEWDDFHSFSCETGLTYYYSHCLPYYYPNGKCVAVDWLTFLWDVAKSSGGNYTFETIANAFKDSDPIDWTAGDTQETFNKIRDGAVEAGITQSTWINLANANGNHY